MSYNRLELAQNMLKWCDSVEKTWKPREFVPRPEISLLIPEEFLAVALRNIRVLCDQIKEGK